MSQITKKTLEYLSELSRIELDKESEEKLLKDLQKILTYFEELKEVDTENIEPMAGGTIEKNIFREDADLRGLDAELRGQSQRESAFSQRRSALIEQFPEEENGFLKVPAVFE